ncbi:hypothetical protein EIN_467110 [Entamoeba invadens IP1]|uniref:OB domain-containing protein n=1 Tax=Entamoeba invadens IP1 TaxID=370355 RepID=A0A0A1TUE6_ENTIV|nr:hypothetical protein EIN_467110 [Entamoeba invadens IP1]ELP83657.1 hypothetical protein EIN_467110 [Entamoeba invadens IP1]|eukprot:XP_004183003.1 hypothetical protein EIN_467110 [Entamoeba invadens IP1]
MSMSDIITKGNLLELFQTSVFTKPLIVRVNRITKSTVIEATIGDDVILLDAYFYESKDQLEIINDGDFLKIMKAEFHILCSYSKETQIKLEIIEYEKVDTTRDKLVTCDYGNGNDLNLFKCKISKVDTKVDSSDLSKRKITPFAVITTMTNNVTIKGRVISKSNITKKVTGTKFCFLLQDANENEMTVNCYDNECEEAFDRFQVGSVYFIYCRQFKEKKDWYTFN